MAKWYQKITEGIPSGKIFKKSFDQAKDDKCPACGIKHDNQALAENFYVCQCGFHYKITSFDYFDGLFGEKAYTLLFENIQPVDILGFTDRISYNSRLTKVRQSTGLNEAINIATGKCDNFDLLAGAMDFNFIGGTMGSVVGEKIRLASNYCIEHNMPLLLISRSSGARLMEGMFSLMQMVKTTLAVSKLDEHRIPFISYLINPVMGGVTASYGMIADFVIAEPRSLIGYTGPRIIKESIGKEPPNDFQKSEFLLKNGFIDMIINRNELKPTIIKLINLIRN
ncbi:MAG: acetyl-CoA carboxylase carboxyl transferase subunit beta [Sphingobacteriales bacterium]|nr:acetyl-CoA carboxylase carboxyl transferase subunit beta [Sphingobacteriales bacterium]